MLQSKQITPSGVTIIAFSGCVQFIQASLIVMTALLLVTGTASRFEVTRVSAKFRVSCFAFNVFCHVVVNPFTTHVTDKISFMCWLDSLLVLGYGCCCFFTYSAYLVHGLTLFNGVVRLSVPGSLTDLTRCCFHTGTLSLLCSWLSS